MQVDIASVVWELMHERHRTLQVLNLISRHPPGAVFRYQVSASDEDSCEAVDLTEQLASELECMCRLRVARIEARIAEL